MDFQEVRSLLEPAPPPPLVGVARVLMLGEGTSPLGKGPLKSNTSLEERRA